MKTFHIAVAILGLVAAGVVVVGFLLPATRSGTETRTLDVAPDLLRQTILDVESQPRWRARVAAVERTGDAVWTEITTDGERVAFRLLTATDTRVALFFDSNRGYSGRWDATIAETATGGATLTVREEATTPSPLGRILSRLFFDPQAFAAAYLDELAAETARRRDDP